MEDRGVRIVVDRDNLLTVGHARLVLNRPADADSDVQARPRTVVPVWPTWWSRSIKPRSTAARVAPGAPPRQLARSQTSRKLSLLPTPGAAGDDHARGLQVDFLLLHMLGEDLDRQVRLRKADRLLDHLGLARAVRHRHRHHAFAHRRHLRPAVIVDNGRDDVAAERRTNLQQQVVVHFAGLFDLVAADLQVRAVGGQPRLDRTGHARRQVASGVAPNSTICGRRRKHLGVGSGLVRRKQAVVGQVDGVGPVGDQGGAGVVDLVSRMSTAPSGTPRRSASSRALPSSSSEISAGPVPVELGHHPDVSLAIDTSIMAPHPMVWSVMS
jgi:hypothetical protein